MATLMWMPDASLASLGITRVPLGTSWEAQTHFELNWQPRYVAVEGTDGVGKTRLVKNLVTIFQERGAKVIRVKEPTDRLKDYLEGQPAPSTAWACEAFARDRKALLATQVHPHLQQDFWVISDRSVWSSYAYQVGGLGLPQAKADQWCHWSIDPVGWPGQTIWVQKGNNQHQPTNQDLLANLQGSHQYLPDFLNKVEAHYKTLAHQAQPNQRWITSTAKPKAKAVQNLAEEILGFQDWARHQGMTIENQPRLIRNLATQWTRPK